MATAEASVRVTTAFSQFSLSHISPVARDFQEQQGVGWLVDWLLFWGSDLENYDSAGIVVNCLVCCFD